MPHDDLIERLKVRMDSLEERNRQLEDLLAPSAIIVLPEWCLTASEARVFAHLTTREVCTKSGIMFALYSDRIDEDPEQKIVDVFICKMRRKLKPFGIAIRTVWGQGYSLERREQFAGTEVKASALAGRLDAIAEHIAGGDVGKALSLLRDLRSAVFGKVAA